MNFLLTECTLKELQGQREAVLDMIKEETDEMMIEMNKERLSEIDRIIKKIS